MVEAEDCLARTLLQVLKAKASIYKHFPQDCHKFVSHSQHLDWGVCKVYRPEKSEHILKGRTNFTRDLGITCDCDRKYIKGEYRKKLETRDV